MRLKNLTLYELVYQLYINQVYATALDKSIKHSNFKFHSLSKQIKQHEAVNKKIELIKKEILTIYPYGAIGLYGAKGNFEVKITSGDVTVKSI